MGTQSKGWISDFAAGLNKSINETPSENTNENFIEIALSVAIPICKLFEGFRSKPYYCPAGYPTQGYGTVNKPNGTKVSISDAPIDEATANEWLRTTLLRDYIPGVLAASPVLKKYPKTLGALASFAYNLGVPRYRASTLRKRIDVLDWSSAKVEIMKWNKGVVKGILSTLPGLTKRRQVESTYIGT